jgi:hypothetical protein
MGEGNNMPHFGNIEHPWLLRRVSERDRRDWIEMTYIARTPTRLTPRLTPWAE